MKGGKMAIELTAEEKITIVEQHLKTVLYNEYNAELSLIEANAISTPNQSTIDSANAQLKDIVAQKNLLQRELDSLAPETPASN
jgi:hypothetical protein